MFTVPLDNLTRVFMASFSRHISALGGFGGPEKDQVFGVLSPVRTYIVEGPGLAAAPVTRVGAASNVAFLVLVSSSSSSGFNNVNGTVVDFPLG